MLQNKTQSRSTLGFIYNKCSRLVSFRLFATRWKIEMLYGFFFQHNISEENDAVLFIQEILNGFILFIHVLFY